MCIAISKELSSCLPLTRPESPDLCRCRIWLAFRIVSNIGILNAATTSATAGLYPRVIWLLHRWELPDSSQLLSAAQLTSRGFGWVRDWALQGLCSFPSW